jgi:hypothetical protein
MQYPSYDPKLRIAVLTPALSMRQIRRRMARARAVAATADTWCLLAEAVESSRITLPPIEAAMIVLTGIFQSQPGVLERDRFWRLFQVPLFEQLVSADGRILAMECDAHAGLHLLCPDALLPGYCASLETTPCGCGNPQPRLSRFDRLTPSSPPASRVGAAVPAQVNQHSNQQDKQVRAVRRVA